MSAYILPKAHIDFMVSAAGEKFIPLEKSQWYGQLLWDENIRSVAYRYPDYAPQDLPGPIDQYPYDYEFAAHDWGYMMRPSQVFSALDCYVYQSSEHPDWQDSLARKVVDRIRKVWCRRVVEEDAEEPEWVVRCPPL